MCRGVPVEVLSSEGALVISPRDSGRRADRLFRFQRDMLMAISSSLLPLLLRIFNCVAVCESMTLLYLPMRHPSSFDAH